MKKSVIILIGAIYVLAIAIVSFFGLQMDTFNETIYTNKVEFINENIQTTKSGLKYIVVEYDGTDENPTVVQLEWKVYPDNATIKSISFIYDKENTVGEVTKFGTVIFYKKGTITVTIKTNDGRAEEIIKVSAL